jgi:hypothetical protein
MPHPFSQRFCRWCCLLGWMVCLTSCGEPPPVPARYVATTSTSIAFLSWRQQDSSLSGTLVTLTQQSGAETVPVLTRSIPLTGQSQPPTVILMIDTAVFQGTYQSRQRQLLISTPASGSVLPQIWYAVSPQIQQQLPAIFTRFALLHRQLALLTQTVTQPPGDSDVYAYALKLQSAQLALAQMQTQAEAISQMSTPCGSVALAELQASLPAEETFTLSSYASPEEATTHSTLSEQLQVTQRIWKQVHVVPVPALPTLPLPWTRFSSQERTAIQNALTALSALSHQLTRDFQTMAQMRQQAVDLQQAVTTQAQNAGCADV